MTDGNFKEQETKAPAILDGIYIVDLAVTGGVKRDGDGDAADPQETRKRASGDKVAIQCKYCSNQLDLIKRTFKETCATVSECWVNALYDNYEQALLRTEKIII